MLVSKKLLSKLIPEITKMSDEKFTSICNKVGIEVEQILNHDKPEGLEIVFIESFKPHPNSDHINLVTIKKANGTQEVCCGASNVTKDKYAIFAPVGAKLPNGITIAPKDVRGVTSNGMLCAYSEITNLGKEFLSDADKDGIIILDEAILGDKDIAKYVFTDDVIYDLSIPSNRNDLNSLEVLANEIKFSLNKEVEFRTAEKLSWLLKKTDWVGNDRWFDVDETLCNEIGFINHIPDSDEANLNWKQKEILMSCGYKVQNNFVDLMNLFTIYYGNPIHVYDADKVDWSKLAIKKLDKQTQIKALDGNTYTFKAGTIAAFSGDEIISIPGIIGCENSKVTSETRKVIIEVGNFNPKLIRKAAEDAKISTKAQAIFAKGLAPWITQNTFAQIVSYFNEKGIIDPVKKYFNPIVKSVVAYDRELMYNFLGIKEPISFNKILEPELFNVPPYRLDIENQFDVFEEVLKTLDVNKLEPEPIVFEINEKKESPYKNQQKLKSFLCHQGMLETKTYNLSSEEDYNAFNFFGIKEKIQIINPISKARECLRVNLIDEMLKVMQYNIARKRDLFNIFEIQNIQTSLDSTMTNLSMIFINDLVKNPIAHANIEKSFVNIKSLIKQMFKTINEDVTFDLIKLSASEVNDKGLVIKHKDKTIGYITLVKKSIAKKYDILEDVYAVSIDISKFISNQSSFKLNKVSTFPTVKRDVNIETSNHKAINKIIKLIKEHNNVTTVAIKDTFSKDGKTIYTLGIDINSIEQTLSTEQIDSIIKEINTIIEQNK